MSVAVLPRVLGRPMMIDEQNVEQRILIEIAEAMERTKYQPLRRVDLRYDAGRVILLGIVPTYFLKQLAQVSAMSVSGVGQIDNQLRVADGESHRPDAPLEEVEQPICFRETSRLHSSAMLASAQAASDQNS